MGGGPQPLFPAQCTSIVFLAHCYAALAWLLPMTGSLLAYKALHPILDLLLAKFPARKLSGY